MGEVYDPHVGPAILYEAGVGYVIQAHLALLLVVVVHMGGMWFSIRRRHPRELVDVPHPEAPEN